MTITKIDNKQLKLYRIFFLIYRIALNTERYQIKSRPNLPIKLKYPHISDFSDTHAKKDRRPTKEGGHTKFNLDFDVFFEKNCKGGVH